EAGRAMGDMIPKPFQRHVDFPPEGRPLAEAERDDILQKQEALRLEANGVVPLLDALRERGGDLLKLLTDPSLDVKLAATQGLENIGYARLRLRERALSVPVLAGQPKNTNTQLLDAHDPFAPNIKSEWPTLVRLL